MLNAVSEIINKRLEKSDSLDEFKEVISESFLDENLDLLERDSKMNDIDLFMEDTVNDFEPESNLYKEQPYDDNYSQSGIKDITDQDLTDLQSDDAYDDNYTASYENDLLANTMLDKEAAYSDNQTTPVDITGFSNEDADFALECGANCSDDDSFKFSLEEGDNTDDEDLTEEEKIEIDGADDDNATSNSFFLEEKEEDDEDDDSDDECDDSCDDSDDDKDDDDKDDDDDSDDEDDDKDDDEDDGKSKKAKSYFF